jgi:hypothetical protein
MSMADKKADLAGPGIGSYEDLEKILPSDYSPILDRKETMKALFAAKNYIEENMCKELNLMMVQVPLIVDVESGVNGMVPVPRFNFTSPTTMERIPSMPRWCRQPPSGKEWLLRNSAARWAKESTPI